MKEKTRFRGPADSISPRAKLELRAPRAPSGNLDARSKPTSRRPASWRVPRKKRLETLPFAQFANLAARLRRRVPQRPRPRFDPATSALSRFRAPDVPLRVSRASNPARNLVAPFSEPALAPTSPRASLDASRVAPLFGATNAARAASLPRPTPAFFSSPRPTPAFFSSPRPTSRPAILRASESLDADSPTAPGDAPRYPRLESTPSPRAVLRAVPDVASRSKGGEEGAAPGFESTLSLDAPRSSSTAFALSTPTAIQTRSRDAPAFGKDALLSAPNETSAPTLRRVEARFGTARERRDGGVEAPGDTSRSAFDSVATTRFSTRRANGDSVSKEDALFLVNPRNNGATEERDGRKKEGSSVLETRDDSTGRSSRSVANWRFQTNGAPRAATDVASTATEGFAARRFALDRGDRGVSTLGADALEGRGRFREAAWGASFPGRGSVEPTRSATSGSATGRRDAPTQWPTTETPRESANLATIERLLKESRDALVNLARDSKGDWTLDVE